MASHPENTKQMYVIFLEETLPSDKVIHYGGSVYKRVGMGLVGLRGYPVSFKLGERPDADHDMDLPSGVQTFTGGRWQNLMIV